jgi:HSP20 family protein
MQLTRWTPNNNFFTVPTLFDSFFNDFFSPEKRPTEKDGLWGWNPAVDVYENDEAIIVKAELPGVDKNQITVDVEGRVLTIKGERKYENEVKEDNYYRRERSYGSFHRAFTLPDDVDPDAIKADYKDGVLKIQVPKSEAHKPKQITVH